MVKDAGDSRGYGYRVKAVLWGRMMSLEAG